MLTKNVKKKVEKQEHMTMRQEVMVSFPFLCPRFTLSPSWIHVNAYQFASFVILKLELQNVAKMGEIYGANRGQDKNSWEQVNVTGKNSENNHAREAIDLIGAFGNCCKGTLDSPASNNSTNKFDISPQLDLSLRRSHPSGSVNQVNDETRRINHSDASAFSR